MNNSHELIDGYSIRPSARPSIHAHNNCPFENMGSYGLKNKNRDGSLKPGTSSKSDTGVDVVDNVMSKYAHSSSPVTCYNSVNKRHSIGSASSNHADSNPEIEKSRSWHAPYDSYNKSVGSENELLGSRDNSNENSYEPLQDTSLPNLDLNDQSKKQNKKSQQLITGVSLIGMLSVVAACYYEELLSTVHGKNITSFYDELKFYNDLNDLGIKYRIKDDSILQVQSGIATIFQNQDAGSFIFMYNSNEKNFNGIQFNNFINDVASTAAKYLRNNSKTFQYTTVDTSHLDMNSHSELMQRYRDDVTKTGVMLIKELDKVPSTLAMAFHYYCDEYNPLVKRSAILFTLDMKKCPSDKKQTAHARIENCLASKWHKIPNDQIGPLLTRVVSTVVDVTGYNG